MPEYYLNIITHDDIYGKYGCLYCDSLAYRSDGCLKCPGLNCPGNRHNNKLLKRQQEISDEYTKISNEKHELMKKEVSLNHESKKIREELHKEYNNLVLEKCDGKWFSEPVKKGIKGWNC